MNKIRLVLKVQKLFFEKKGIRNIYICFTCLFMIILSVFFENIYLGLQNKAIINNLNSNLFTISGVIAGLIFTSMGVISSANNNKINNLKKTKNFALLGKYFNNAITMYLLVVMICIIDVFITKRILIYAITILKLYLFLIATVFFIISVYFTKSLLFVDK